jgi:hypothetical protein
VKQRLGVAKHMDELIGSAEGKPVVKFTDHDVLFEMEGV